MREPIDYTVPLVLDNYFIVGNPSLEHEERVKAIAIMWDDIVAVHQTPYPEVFSEYNMDDATELAMAYGPRFYIAENYKEMIGRWTEFKKWKATQKGVLNIKAN